MYMYPSSRIIRMLQFKEDETDRSYSTNGEIRNACMTLAGKPEITRKAKRYMG
jgi:hypothetical protein